MGEDIDREEGYEENVHTTMYPGFVAAVMMKLSCKLISTKMNIYYQFKAYI